MDLNKLKVGGLFTKSEKQEDGTIIVGGICSSESVDSDGEVILSKAMKEAIPDFMKWATLKEMHKSDTSPGVIKHMEVLEDGKTYIECHVVDPVTVKKVESGVFKGFSIGAGRVVRDALNKLNIIKFVLNEVSLVDRPANPDSLISFVKMDNLDKEEQDLQEQETPSQEVEKSENTPVEPIVEVEAPVETEIQKGLHDVARLAMIVDELKWLQDCFKDEAEYEQDNSQVPEELKQLLISLNAVLVKAVVEETQEINDDLTSAEKSANLNEEQLLIKAGSRNSKSDSERIQKIHDLALELGAVSPPKTFKSHSVEVNLEVESIEKFNKVQSELQDALNKALKLEEEKESLQKRVKELEDLPKPRKASVLSISKSEDYSSTEKNVEVAPVLKGDGSVDELATIFKTQTFQSGLLK